jgi:hypothetical protein
MTETTLVVRTSCGCRLARHTEILATRAVLDSVHLLPGAKVPANRDMLQVRVEHLVGSRCILCAYTRRPTIVGQVQTQHKKASSSAMRSGAVQTGQVSSSPLPTTGVLSPDRVDTRSGCRAAIAPGFPPLDAIAAAVGKAGCDGVRRNARWALVGYAAGVLALFLNEPPTSYRYII